MALNLDLVKFKKSVSSEAFAGMIAAGSTNRPNASTIYFITDTGELYLGETCMGRGSAITSVKVGNTTRTGKAIEIKLSELGGVAGNAAITAHTNEHNDGWLVFYDEKGLVTGGRAITASDIPLLNASKISSGTFDAGLIPSLSPSKITTTDTAQFVSASDKNAWNAKQNALTFTSTPSATNKVVTTQELNSAIAGSSSYLGTISATSGLSTTAKKGDFYRVSVAWTGVHVGDIIIAEKNNPAQAIDSTNWSLLHNEINTDTITKIGIAVRNESGKQPNVTSDLNTGDIRLGDASARMVAPADGLTSVDTYDNDLVTGLGAKNVARQAALDEISKLDSFHTIASGKVFTKINIENGKLKDCVEGTMDSQYAEFKYRQKGASKDTTSNVQAELLDVMKALTWDADEVFA